ncbi:MAG: hypothetical protein A3J38_07190 [Gammaproteobacteria bacterium RIFCSPHIGHO2_12_FULL_45_9]|nr:MAG: hypothetical protein A3J38_07190 [Gammaproteobacteria bacterium RIFCSPHIGHO2_12_FULL_45_9]
MSRSRRPRLTAEQISTMSERDFGKITSDDIVDMDDSTQEAYTLRKSKEDALNVEATAVYDRMREEVAAEMAMALRPQTADVGEEPQLATSTVHPTITPLTSADEIREMLEQASDAIFFAEVDADRALFLARTAQTKGAVAQINEAETVVAEVLAGQIKAQDRVSTAQLAIQAWVVQQRGGVDADLLLMSEDGMQVEGLRHRADQLAADVTDKVIAIHQRLARVGDIGEQLAGAPAQAEIQPLASPRLLTGAGSPGHFAQSAREEAFARFEYQRAADERELNNRL